MLLRPWRIIQQEWAVPPAASTAVGTWRQPRLGDGTGETANERPPRYGRAPERHHYGGNTGATGAGGRCGRGGGGGGGVGLRIGRPQDGNLVTIECVVGQPVKEIHGATQAADEKDRFHLPLLFTYFQHLLGYQRDDAIYHRIEDGLHVLAGRESASISIEREEESVLAHVMVVVPHLPFRVLSRTGNEDFIDPDSSLVPKLPANQRSECRLRGRARTLYLTISSQERIIFAFLSGWTIISAKIPDGTIDGIRGKKNRHVIDELVS